MKLVVREIVNPIVNKEFIEKWQNITQSHNFEYYTPLEI